MKKLLLFVLLSWFAQMSVAQTISSAKYPFASATGATMEDLSSGATTLVSSGSDDGTSGLTDIGFDFWFVGVRYTQFDASANGFIRLGTTITTGTPNYNNNIGNNNQVPKIAPYWDDLNTSSIGSVRYKLLGTAPNRKLVVEWKECTF